MRSRIVPRGAVLVALALVRTAGSARAATGPDLSEARRHLERAQQHNQQHNEKKQFRAAIGPAGRAVCVPCIVTLVLVEGRGWRREGSSAASNLPSAAPTVIGRGVGGES